MVSKENNQLLEALQNCTVACNYCFSCCLAETDVQMMVDCIRLDADCAAICNLTATLVARDSQHGKHLLNECIEICEACAAECEKHAEHMDHCKACAEACRYCAALCKTTLHQKSGVRL